jgi:hypothetical protein
MPLEIIPCPFCVFFQFISYLNIYIYTCIYINVYICIYIFVQGTGSFIVTIQYMLTMYLDEVHPHHPSP